jgi:O-acetyl-ADP-ribose deacetylase (regulator of RNase III)
VIVERIGDLPSSHCPALGHGVNTLGLMGAGIAVEFRRRWPTMYQAYREECRSGRLQPGGLFVYQAADRLITILATQRGVGRGAPGVGPPGGAGDRPASCGRPGGPPATGL